MWERKTKAISKEPLTLTAVHYHKFIYRSNCAAYVTSDQHRFEFFLQVLLLHNKCFFDSLYCQNMPTSAHIDINVLRCMTSFPWQHNWNISFLNFFGCLAYLNKNKRIFRSKKILSSPFFGGEVKSPVPSRRFAACKRYLNLRGSRNLGKITGQFMAQCCTFRC